MGRYSSDIPRRSFDCQSNTLESSLKSNIPSVVMPWDLNDRDCGRKWHCFRFDFVTLSQAP